MKDKTAKLCLGQLIIIIITYSNITFPESLSFFSHSLVGAALLLQ